jgi:hypothetical protein
MILATSLPGFRGEYIGVLLPDGDPVPRLTDDRIFFAVILGGIAGVQSEQMVDKAATEKPFGGDDGDHQL